MCIYMCVFMINPMEILDLSGGWRAPAALDLLELLLHRAVDAAAPESAQRPGGRVQLESSGGWGYGMRWEVLGKCLILEILNITFKYLLEMILLYIPNSWVMFK